MYELRKCINFSDSIESYSYALDIDFDFLGLYKIDDEGLFEWVVDYRVDKADELLRGIAEMNAGDINFDEFENRFGEYTLD